MINLINYSWIGNLEGVKELISQGVNIHVDADEALRGASERGYLEVVKYLENIKRERKLLKIRERIALRVIGRALHNWLWSPECRDGTIGIGLRLDMENLKLI